ncbi:MAG: endolytic transglycosylase MltG [Ignavibacteria bacterium]
MKVFLHKIKKLYKYLISVNLLLIFFIIFQIFYSKYYWDGDPEKRFDIEQGKNLDEIISDLKSADIIADPLLFKLAVKLSGKESQIISRTYLFKNGMNNSELLTQLTDKNNNQLVRFTVPPGYTIKQIAKLAEKKLSLSKDKFITEASNDSLIRLLELKDTIKNLEGFLFPDSYDVSPSITEKKLVQLLYNEFRKKVLDDDNIMVKIKEQNTTLIKALTLASIIEGETRLEIEKPVIAGVYLNRIKKGMRLEADPTVQYALPDGPKSRLLYEDLKINSPYNTYIVKGLPPGPINNPGLSALNAALNPDENKFLFFVATGEGGHKFSENYEDHLKAIIEYKKRLKQNSKDK